MLLFIIHPAVFISIDRQFNTLPPEQLAPYAVIEAALIYETGMDTSLDYVIVVDADEDLCVKRVMSKGKLGEDDVRRRMAAQMASREKVKLADFVIRNNKTESELHSPVELLDTILSQLSPMKRT